MALFDCETTMPPIKRGGRYFFIRNGGLDNQPQLVVRDPEAAADRVLTDPNGWSANGTVALAEWASSGDGAYAVFAMQDGGSDWRTIRVMNVTTGTSLDDTVAWARFTNIAWSGDGSGFYYSRFPEPEVGDTFSSGIEGHAIYCHRVGTVQSEFRLVHAPTPGRTLLQTVDVTADGRHLIVYTSALTGGAALTVTDLAADNHVSSMIVVSHYDSWAVARQRWCDPLPCVDMPLVAGHFLYPPKFGKK